MKRYNQKSRLILKVITGEKIGINDALNIMINNLGKPYLAYPDKKNLDQED